MAPTARDYQVIVASPFWSMNGANVLCANLVRGLNRVGVKSHIVLTEFDRPDIAPMDQPNDLRFERLDVTPEDLWTERWKKMIRYLEERSPCIYFPNYDYRFSCISPKLGPQVGIVGILHGDDPLHYDHFRWLGHYWNATVAVSEEVRSNAMSFNRAAADRLVTVRTGVELPASPPAREFKSAGPIRIAYAGRLVQHPKRIFDLVGIMRELEKRGADAELTMFGAGQDEEKFRELGRDLIERGRIKLAGIVENQKLPAHFAQHDVFILTSEFEGMPISLIEAMGQGCIPVVADIPSGIPNLVHQGRNGFRVPVGDVVAFAQKIALLHSDADLRRRFSLGAYAAVDQGNYRVSDMVESYAALFDRVMHELHVGGFRRPSGRIKPPTMLGKGWWNHPPNRLIKIKRRVGAAYRRLGSILKGKAD